MVKCEIQGIMAELETALNVDGSFSFFGSFLLRRKIIGKSFTCRRNDERRRRRWWSHFTSCCVPSCRQRFSAFLPAQSPWFIPDKFTFMTKHIKRHSIVPAIQLLPAHCSTFYCSTKYHSTLSAHSPEFPGSSEKIPASWKFNSTQIRVCVCAPCLASLTPTSLLPFRLHHHPLPPLASPQQLCWNWFHCMNLWWKQCVCH